MIKLNKGNYSGDVSRRLSNQNTFISIVHYYPDNTSFGMHYHENAHLCMLLQGEDVEKRNGVSYMRNCGDVYFYPAGQAHATISQNKSTKSLIVEFDNNFMNANSLSELQLEKEIGKKGNLNFQLLKLLFELEQCGPADELSIQSAVLNLFHTPAGLYEKGEPKWSQLVKEILRENWNQSVSLEDLSGVIHIHPVTISKYFSKYNHCTIGEYIRRLRIEKSIPLIKNTDMKLVEIAHYCGFADQSHFIRVFRDAIGFLPTELRKI